MRRTLQNAIRPERFSHFGASSDATTSRRDARGDVTNCDLIKTRRRCTRAGKAAGVTSLGLHSPVTSCGTTRQVTTHPVSHHLAGLPPSVVTSPVAFSTPLSSGHQFDATDLERERRPPLFRLLKVLVTACTRSTDGKVPLREHGRPGLFSSAVLSEVLLGRGGHTCRTLLGTPVMSALITHLVR